MKLFFAIIAVMFFAFNGNSQPVVNRSGALNTVPSGPHLEKVDTIICTTFKRDTMFLDSNNVLFIKIGGRVFEIVRNVDLKRVEKVVPPFWRIIYPESTTIPAESTEKLIQLNKK